MKTILCVLLAFVASAVAQRLSDEELDRRVQEVIDAKKGKKTSVKKPSSNVSSANRAVLREPRGEILPPLPVKDGEEDLEQLAPDDPAPEPELEFAPKATMKAKGDLPPGARYASSAEASVSRTSVKERISSGTSSEGSARTTKEFVTVRLPSREYEDVYGNVRVKIDMPVRATMDERKLVIAKARQAMLDQGKCVEDYVAEREPTYRGRESDWSEPKEQRPPRGPESSYDRSRPFQDIVGVRPGVPYARPSRQPYRR
jgi:hypothetical protein